MKRNIALLAAAICLLFAKPGFAGPQDFILTNSSASYICYVYISPADSDDWEEDILGSDCMAPGESYTIRFSDTATPLWDLMVEDDDGKTEEYYGFNLKTISEIVIRGGGQASYR